MISNNVINSFTVLKEQAGVSVTYTRGDRAVTLTAVPGETTFEIESGDVIESAQSRDFLILASELILGGYASTPQRGDTIREVIDGVEQVFDVRAPAGSNHFRFMDPYRNVLRIYTTQTSDN